MLLNTENITNILNFVLSFQILFCTFFQNLLTFLLANPFQIHLLLSDNPLNILLIFFLHFPIFHHLIPTFRLFSDLHFPSLFKFLLKLTILLTFPLFSLSLLAEKHLLLFLFDFLVILDYLLDFLKFSD